MKFKYLFLLFVFTFNLEGCSYKTDLTEVSLMLDYTPNTNHTGIYVAEEKGYYEEYGLQVELIDSSSSSTIEAVSNQVVDFGISYEEDLTLAQNAGIENLKSIYAILKENTSGFISYKEKGITTPADFKNKTYCGWGGTVEKAIVQEVANSYGVNNNEFDIAITEADFLRSNKQDCDFFWEFAGWAGIEADISNVDYNYISLKDLGYDFYSPIIITSYECMKYNDAIVQNFVSATIKGYEYSANNPQEAAEIFLKYNPSYDENLILNSQKFLSNYYIADNGQAGYQDADVWQEFTNFLNSSSIVSSNEYKELYTNEYVNKYYKS